MKTKHTHSILVSSHRAPTIEVDAEAQSFYVRFSSAKVAKTITREARTMHLALDLDANGELVGIEAIGCQEMSIAQILAKAEVKAPNIDFAQSRLVVN